MTDRTLMLRMKARLIEDMDFSAIQQVLETLNVEWMLDKETKVPSQTEIRKVVDSLLSRIVNEGFSINGSQYLMLKKLGFEAAYYGRNYPDNKKAGTMTLSFPLEDCHVTPDEVREENIESAKTYSVPFNQPHEYTDMKVKIDQLSNAVVQLQDNMNKMRILLERQMNLSMQIRKDQTKETSDYYYQNKNQFMDSTS